jgi:hypothetical protein
MASEKKSLPTKLGALAAAGGFTALTVQAYRHPLETTAALSRAAMLLAGARDGTCYVGEYYERIRRAYLFAGCRNGI